MAKSRKSPSKKSALTRAEKAAKEIKTARQLDKEVASRIKKIQGSCHAAGVKLKKVDLFPKLFKGAEGRKEASSAGRKLSSCRLPGRKK